MGIKKAIIKRVTHPKKYNYHIWRGILEFLYLGNTKEGKKNRVRTKECIDEMGAWASGKVTLKGKEKSEGYWGAVDQIIDAFCIDNSLYVYTRRPGALIGKSGTVIDDLRDFLGVEHINIIETPSSEMTTELRTSYMVTVDYI